jgi:hypothetical protein
MTTRRIPSLSAIEAIDRSKSITSTCCLRSIARCDPRAHSIGIKYATDEKNQSLIETTRGIPENLSLGLSVDPRIEVVQGCKPFEPRI